MGLFTTIWRQSARNLVFSPCIDQPQSDGPQSINHGSRKVGQAAGAGGLEQDRYVDRSGTYEGAGVLRLASCVVVRSVCEGMLTASLLRVRREGHRAAKDCAQVEARELTGRQEAAGRAEEAERAADHGRRGGQHVQGGRKRVALQCSQRSVLVFSFFFSPPPVVDCIVWGLTLWWGGVATTRY